MSRLLIPNTTQVPNVLLDQVMRQVSDPALRVLLAIVRKTYGFQKTADNISLTQLQEITALSRQGVVNGIKALGPLIEIRQGKREGNQYALNLNIETGQLVNGMDQSTGLTSQRRGQITSQRRRHTKPNKNKTKDLYLKKDKDNDSRIQPLIASFSEKFRKATGKPYIPTAWGKDAMCLKRLLAAGVGPEEIERVMGLYFADDFANRTGFDIGRFCNQFNSLNSGKGQEESEPRPSGVWARKLGE
jgi:phage replication O-like protein O